MLGAALVAVLLAACTRAHAVASDRATLRIGTLAQPDRLDPILATDYFDSDVFAMVFQGLVRFAPDGSLRPDLAVAVPTRANGGISPDGRTLTYHLRAARWQDGVPVGARDVIFTWHALMDPHNAVPRQAGYDRIVTIDAPNARTVRVRLRAPYAPARALFARRKQGAIVPAHRLARVADLARSRFESHPLGSGPYQVVRWSRGNEIDLRRSPFVHAGFHRVRLIFYGDERSEVEALETGAIDVALGLSASTAHGLAANPALRVATRPSYQFEHITFNLRPGSGPQTDPVVRRAIAHALDVRRYARTVFFGEAGLAPLDQAPWSWARDRSVHFYAYDPARARQLLREAGYRLPLHLTLTSTSGDVHRELLELQMQRDLARAGMRVRLIDVPAAMLLAPADLGGLLASGKFQLALVAFVPDSSDPDDESYVESRDVPPNGINMADFRDPQVDRLVRAAVATDDRAARKRDYDAIQQRLIAELPFYTIAWLPDVVVMRRSIVGPEPMALGSPLWNVAQWRRVRAR